MHETARRCVRSSGSLKLTRRIDGFRILQCTQVLKVKAHASNDGLIGAAACHKEGNDEAYRAANRGAHSHPSPSQAESDRIAHHIEVSRAVVRLAAPVLPEWARVDLDGVPCVAGGGRQAKPSSPEHYWEWCRSFRRCSVCVSTSRNEHKPSRSGCTGIGYAQTCGHGWHFQLHSSRALAMSRCPPPASR